MSASRVAIRYAKALIDALVEKNALNEADTFLEFCKVVGAHRPLKVLLANVTVSTKHKVKIVNALAEKLEIPELIKRFLHVLASHNRLAILDEVGKAVSRRLDAHNNVHPVTLTTAGPTTDEELDRFQAAMERALESGVRVETRVDADILGGALAQVGSKIYDGSVRGQLGRLREDLVKENS